MTLKKTTISTYGGLSMIRNKKSELEEFIKILSKHKAKEITKEEKNSVEFKDSILRSRKINAANNKKKYNG